MATRRRIGVSLATTEAARRQLMQPVPCWEKTWVSSDINSNLKVHKWVKTDKSQHFSDDEGEADEPLAPLPDEPEIIEGDEEMDQEENVATSNAEMQQKDNGDVEGGLDDPPSKVSSPKPQLSMSLRESADLGGDTLGDGLEASLKPLDANMEDDEDDKKANGIELNISGLGSDGLQLESSHDLSQLDSTDSLAGGNLMDHSGDPFAEAT